MVSCTWKVYRLLLEQYKRSCIVHTGSQQQHPVLQLLQTLPQITSNSLTYCLPNCMSPHSSAHPPVYSTEGAASVVPDRVTDIFMAAYSQLQGPQHKLHFFKLLVSEFGVQREWLRGRKQLCRLRHLQCRFCISSGHASAGMFCDAWLLTGGCCCLGHTPCRFGMSASIIHSYYSCRLCL